MRKDSGGRRGAALAMVFIITIGMSILVAAVYVLFRSNARSQQYTRDRIGALFTAEAGARLAAYHLSLGTAMPEGNLPFHMPDDSSGWISMEGVQGKALVVLDPRNNVENPFAIRGVEIRSRGRVNGEERDIKVHYAPDSPSRYALLVDAGISPGFFTDGRVIEGPVHCNGIIDFSSFTPDSSGDPFVKEVSTTTEGGFRFADVGFQDVPHPEGSSVWVRPYRSHRGGSPSWNTNARPIDFHRIEQHFHDLFSVASSMGTVITGVKRIVLDRRAILMRSDNMGPVTRLELGPDINLIYIMNGAMPVYIKSGQVTTVPLTIVATGNVYLSGNVYGSPAGGQGPLAIVSLGDIIIPADPSYTGGTDWHAPWDIQTEGNMSVQAYLAAPSGELRAESLMYPGDPVYLRITGGLMQENMGALGTAMSGYRLEIEYDNGLFGVMPPHFPILENWIMTSWQEDPEYVSGGIEADQY